MLLILVTLYLLPSVIQATPTSLLDNSTVTDQVTSASQLPPTYPERSIWDILWSCLATIFACTWVSVHPNIPPQGKKRWMAPLRRLELMIWAILTPELIILWAMRQWIVARKLALEYKSNKDPTWTKTHGYFLQMGGFALFNGNDFQGFVYSEVGGQQGDEDIKNLAAMKLFPTTTEEEIKDRSKGDGLSKALALGQTLWFVMQCIGRHIEGLYITELELATGAFAVLKGFMYFLWWNKPLDVRCPVRIQMLDAPGHGQSKDVTSDTQTTRSAPIPVISQILPRLAEMCGLRPGGPAPIGSTFYASTKEGGDGLAMVFASIAAVIFGGIHCVGWVFTFPSHTELMIWRISSMIITTVPLISIVYGFFISHRQSSPREGIFETIVEALAGVSMLFYIIARVLLLAEAFTTLRNLPPGAYEVVKWLTFIPHI